MNINKAYKRDRKYRRDRYGHQEDGRSVKLIKEEMKKRALKIRKEQLQKQELLEGD